MKHIIAILILLFEISNLNAQQTINISQLVGTKWKLASNKNYRELDWTFGKTEITQTRVYTFPVPIIKPSTGEVMPNVYDEHFKYYLAISNQTKFNELQVGKSTRGRYLALLGRRNELDCFKIISLTSDSLVLQQSKICKDDNNMNITITHNYTYIRVKD
ncbi:MAG: hypothetical protein MJY81_03785 [Bacteroidaceae bacterium]|nr:hypothetical protein [Bacteroidaceae bacterium]